MDRSTSRPSIVVVDNERLIRTFLEEVLRAEGYDVAVAYNGFEALRLLRSVACDLMLLDVEMPGMDGWQTLALVRVEHPDLRVVMMSGVVDCERVREAGAQGFLQKPYYREEVLRAVSAQLPERGRPAA